MSLSKYTYWKKYSFKVMHYYNDYLCRNVYGIPASFWLKIKRVRIEQEHKNLYWLYIGARSRYSPIAINSRTQAADMVHASYVYVSPN